MMTVVGKDIPDIMFEKYLSTLINQFFKILPLKETGEPSLNDYMCSLRLELIGNSLLITALNDDVDYLRLLAVLQSLIDCDCDTKVVKREVFKAINICKKLREKYFDRGVEHG